MSGAANCPETPRQKMIGMMYLVLTAMLALNVSADILNGFVLVNNSLRSTLNTSEIRNNALYNRFEYDYEQNPVKVGEWLGKARVVRAEADSVFNFIQGMKMRIARIADGAGANPDSLVRGSNLDAAGQVGLVERQGIALQQRLHAFRDTLNSVVEQEALRDQFSNMFAATSTRPGTPWENQLFEFMPAVASITILTKFQNDIRNAEAEAVQYLMRQTDAGDFRVNLIDAAILATSDYVISGGQYTAQIILAAQDTTKKPIVTIGGRVIPDGLYKVPASTVGTHTYKGTIELPGIDGADPIIRPFTGTYTVGAPVAIISADLMNVFYAGIENPVSISVPGVPAANINATIEGGTITRTAKGWSVKPARVGQNAVIKVSATIDGKSQFIGDGTFRVKALPPPVAFIAYRDAQDNPAKYKGGTPFNKAFLLASAGVRAELDDADLDVTYTVLSFETNMTDAMGNTIIELSDGNKFSARQMNAMRGLARGKRFFITRTRAKGPDGIERVLPPIEVIVN